MKIPISFKKSEKEIYDYICSKRDKSAYIKDLVEADMKSKNNNKKKERKSSSFEIDV